MKRAAIGVQMHSGWGVLVAVSEDPVEILARQRFVTADPEMRGAIQPYHFATGLKSPDQEKHLAQCAAASSRLAAAAIAEVVKELSGRDYRVAGAAVLSASGRPLPALAVILAAHPLIHTAEGEFFRHAVCTACEALRHSETRRARCRARLPALAVRLGHPGLRITRLQRWRLHWFWPASRQSVNR